MLRRGVGGSCLLRPLVPFAIEPIDAAAVPETRTKIMLTVGDPGQAFKFAMIPNAGVGLARTEFIINNHIGVHPMALCRFPKLQDQEAIDGDCETNRS